MGPELVAIVPYVTAAATAATAGATVYSASAQSAAMEAQAEADQRRAKVQSDWAERKANEERAAAQDQAGQEIRQARMAQSRLGAVAGASGSGASDPTVTNLFEGIGMEGYRSAGNTQAAGEQRAQTTSYQAALDRWTTDANSAIKRSSAKSTLIGGYLSAAGQLGSGFSSAMGMKYGPTKLSGSTGYGAR